MKKTKQKYYICHPCKHKRNPDSISTIREYLLGKKGISSDWYSKTLEEQNGVCDICKKPQTEIRNDKIKNFNVDHNHNCCATGCVKCIRGLLCSNCNRALGKFNDDIETLKNAIEYLSKHPKIGDIPEGNGG
jgi:hypothetical protein